MKGKTNAHTFGGYVPSELVTVNVTADNDILPEEFEITITDSDGNVLIVSSESTFSIRIPYNTTYTVSASNVEGYFTPLSQTLTASLITRNISIIYKELVYGVFIQDISGNLYTEDEWDGTQTVNGIAVSTEQCSFVMPHNYVTTYGVWSSTLTLLNGITTTTDSSQAILDFDGKEQTDTIIQELGTGNAPVAEACKAYTFPNGQKGYLGAAGEWNVWNDNFSAISSACIKCGGVLPRHNMLLTSTQYDKEDVYVSYSMNNELSISRSKKSYSEDNSYIPFTVL